jgi:hypothetical protein
LLNIVVVAPPRAASPGRSASLLPDASAHRTRVPGEAIRVLNPPDGAVYLIDPTLRREFQTIGLRGATERMSSLEWRVDDTPIGTSGPDSALNWPLTPGRHVISARDPQGRHASASIVVK